MAGVERDQNTGAITCVLSRSQRIADPLTRWSPLSIGSSFIRSISLSDPYPIVTENDNRATAILVDDDPRLAYCNITKSSFKRKLVAEVKAAGSWVGLHEDYNLLNYQDSDDQDSDDQDYNLPYYQDNSYHQVVFSDYKKRCYVYINDIGIQVYDLHSSDEEIGNTPRKLYELPLKHLIHEIIRVSTIDPGPNSHLIDESWSIDVEICTPYLVPFDNGDLILLLQHGDDEFKRRRKRAWKTLGFDLFRVNFYNGELERVHALGDRSIFISPKTQSFSVWAHKYPGVQPGCIYFTSSNATAHFPSYMDAHHLDFGVYSLQHNKVSPLNQSPIIYGVDMELNKDPVDKIQQLCWVAPPNLVQ